MIVRPLIACGLVLALFVTPSTADDAKKDKKKKGAGVAGKVVSFEKAKDGGGTLKVETVVRKKKAANADEKKAAGEAKTFTLTKDTKIQKVSGKKGDRKTEAGTVDDLKAGVIVRITADGDKVKEVTIMAGRGARKKKDQ